VVNATPGVDVEPKAVVRQVAIATVDLHGMNINGAGYDTWWNAAGVVQLRVMKKYNHGLDRLPVVSHTRAEVISKIQRSSSRSTVFRLPRLGLGRRARRRQAA
jgi:hypothetical protein